MDKIRPILSAIKQYHFWALSLLATLIGLFSWLAASASLTEEFKEYQSEVERKMRSVQQIARDPSHPNKETVQGIKSENEKLKQEVLRLWKDLYERQRDEVLYWPKELRADFRKTVEELSFDDDISGEFRTHYMYTVQKLLTQLPKIVQALDNVDPAAGPRGAQNRGRRAGAAQEEEVSYIVIWNDLDRIYQKYYWDKRPIVRKVWVTQEDLWVYQNLLTIIARTNEGATGPHNAAIKIIDALEVGPDAADGTKTSGRILFEGPRGGGGGGRGGGGRDMFGGGGPGGGMPGGMSGMGGMGGMPRSGPGRGMPGRMGRMSGGGGIDPEMEKSQLMAGRYLDAKGQPIWETENSTAKVVEYKRLPVRMRLEMDVRKLPKLLVECANAPLPVEPSQVRINPEKSGSGRGSGRSRGGRGMGMMGGMMPNRGAAGTTNKEEIDPAIAQVEIQGIVYIYNPPDEATLGSSSDGGAISSNGTGGGASDSNSTR